MENTQQKTPEQWFQMLKEPYRSEAIANINIFHYDYNEFEESLYNSLLHSFFWINSKQGLDYWSKIHNSIKAGETTYLEPENVSLINEVNNSQVTEQQNEIESEKVELRPENLVSGEVYRAVKDSEFSFIFRFLEKKYNMIWHDGLTWLNIPNKKSHGWILDTNKFYHATPEEKKLLLGEEQTDWEAKYNELKVENDSLKVGYRVLNEKFDELRVKFDQLEPKGEKVYFYTDHSGNLRISNDIQFALEKAGEDYRIYESNVIGKKKSVLIDEL